MNWTSTKAHDPAGGLPDDEAVGPTCESCAHWDGPPADTIGDDPILGLCTVQPSGDTWNDGTCQNHEAEKTLKAAPCQCAGEGACVPCRDRRWASSLTPPDGLKECCRRTLATYAEECDEEYRLQQAEARLGGATITAASEADAEVLRDWSAQAEPEYGERAAALARATITTQPKPLPIERTIDHLGVDTGADVRLVEPPPAGMPDSIDWTRAEANKATAESWTLEHETRFNTQERLAHIVRGASKVVLRLCDEVERLRADEPECVKSWQRMFHASEDVTWLPHLIAANPKTVSACMLWLAAHLKKGGE